MAAGFDQDFALRRPHFALQVHRAFNTDIGAGFADTANDLPRSCAGDLLSASSTLTIISQIRLPAAIEVTTASTGCTAGRHHTSDRKRKADPITNAARVSTRLSVRRLFRTAKMNGHNPRHQHD